MCQIESSPCHHERAKKKSSAKAGPDQKKKKKKNQKTGQFQGRLHLGRTKTEKKQNKTGQFLGRVYLASGFFPGRRHLALAKCRPSRGDAASWLVDCGRSRCWHSLLSPSGNHPCKRIFAAFQFASARIDCNFPSRKSASNGCKLRGPFIAVTKTETNSGYVTTRSLQLEL